MDSNQVKKRNKRSKVSPAEKNEGVENNAYELDDVFDGEEDKTKNFNRKSFTKLSKFKENADNVAHAAKSNALEVITNVKTGVSRWKKYTTSRRLHKNEPAGTEDDVVKMSQAGGIGLDEIHNNFVQDKKMSLAGNWSSKLSAENNRALIRYFAELGRKMNENERVNLDFVESLLEGGASIDCTDKYGQTVLHEVARAWHVDVAKFLIEKGSNVNQADDFGRSPLHVAAAVDYPEMVNILAEHGADVEARTKGEEQTPIHYAAKNDACQSMTALIKKGCEFKNVRDYKGRTPIHVASELDRSETALLLLELGAPVGVSDDSGQKAITLMMTKMPPVAKEALNQFHTKDRANRKQFFRLDLLTQDNKAGSFAQSPLQVATAYKQYDLVTHKVFLRLLQVQWQKYGRFGAWRAICFNLVFILLWTVMATLVEYDKRHEYILPEQWWRVLLFIAAVILTVYQITDELIEFYRSRKSHNLWKDWREKEIERDIQYTHPRWPEEKKFLTTELSDLDKISPKYFNDWWNVFDWVCYILLLASIITHIVDVISHTNGIARAHIRIMAINIILLWLRLMKNARAFEPLGPFIVILAHMFGDVLRFAFLYLEFYIPYVCAFWMLFGGEKYAEIDVGKVNATEIVVSRFHNINEVFFSLFRLTLVDEYDYDNMKLVDSLMADVLLGTWFALSAILCLNLFIALLSDTFQRVYDNAQANAVMQKTITVLSIWDSMGKNRRRKFQSYLLQHCSPLEEYYDDDMTTSGDEDLKKVTFQVKDKLEELCEKLENGGFNTETTSVNGNGVVSIEKFENEIGILKEGISDLRVRHDDLTEQYHEDMHTVMALLREIAGYPRESGAGHHDMNVRARSISPFVPYGKGEASVPLRHNADDRQERRRRKKRREKGRGLLEDDLVRPGLQPSSIPGIHLPTSEYTETGRARSGQRPAIEVTSLAPQSARDSPTRPSSWEPILPSNMDVRVRTDHFGTDRHQSQDPSSEC